MNELWCDSCWIHRYEVMHVCLTHGCVISHSQANWDTHRDCVLLTYPSSSWGHDDTTKSFMDNLYATGTFGPWHEKWEGNYFQKTWGM